MAHDQLRVALVSEVFHAAGSLAHLDELLAAARAQGAELAVLPELPLNPWSPSSRTPRPEDAEPPAGARYQLLAAAARRAGIAVLGGVIVDEPGGGRRNRSLLFDAGGQLITCYDKNHLPDEEGFRERDHYGVGISPPRVVAVAEFPLGIQVCSDLNRPELSHALAAGGALAILGPRATEAATWPRWRLVLQATAITACVYVLTVTRPAAEQGVNLGGPSAVIRPDGEVLVETRETLALATLERRAVETARMGYPGYLEVRPDLYRRAWLEAADARAAPASGDAEVTEATQQFLRR
jgi:predicted amidohydrolase